MRSRSALILGALVTCGYLGVAVVTAHVSGHRVLPLYEGVGNLPPYQWVNPPAAFQTGNVVPKANATTVATSASGNKTAAISSSDTQFIVTLSPGAIPARPSSSSVSVGIVPLDPATLGSLPSGARADGNAYRMSVTYQPNGEALTSFTSKASVVFSVPLPANRGIYYSPDGHTWTRIAPPAPSSQTTTIGGSSTHTGVFLAATTHRATASTGSSGTSLGTVLIGIVVGVLLVGGGAWFLLRTFRPATARRKARPTQGRRSPPRRGSR